MNNPKFLQQLSLFEMKIKRREIQDSSVIARETINLLRQSYEGAQSSEDVIDQIRLLTKRLSERFSSESIILNVCDYILVQVFDETRRISSAKTLIPRSRSGVYDLLMPRDRDENISNEQQHDVKRAMNEIFDEVLTELESSYSLLGKWAPSLIQSRDIIMTLGDSRGCLVNLRHSLSGSE